MELKDFIKDVPDFPKPGILFKDISPLLKNPEAMDYVTSIFEKYWEGKADCIAGLDARGFIFGSLLASKMRLPFVMVRKTGKLPGQTCTLPYDLEYGKASIDIQVDAFEHKSRVLIIDDLLATGGTAKAASDLIEMSGGIVAGLGFVIELEELKGRRKLVDQKVQSIITY